MFPWVPVISAIAAAWGLFGLCWYDQLSEQEKERADRLAADYAKQIYDKTIKQLSEQEFSHVLELVKRHFGW